MRILVCHNFYKQFGGEDAVVGAQISLLRRNGNIVKEFFTHSTKAKSYSLLDKCYLGINNIYSRTTKIELDDCIAEYRPDVVHVHNIFPLLSPSIYSVLTQNKIPIVQTIHNFRWMCPNGLFYTHGSPCTRCANGNILAAIYFRCLHGSTTQSLSYALSVGWARTSNLFPTSRAEFIILNQYTARLFKKYLNVPDRRVHILGNFMGDISFKREELEKSRFVFLGRLTPEKGVMTILRVAEKLHQSTFDIVGVGPLEHDLKEMVRKRNLPNVHFYGFLEGESRFNYLEKATALIVPSLWDEQFPMVTIEAFRMGVPVVATRMGGLPDIIQEGKSGFLFDPGDAEGLSHILEILSNDENLRKSVSIGARDRFVNCFSEEVYYPRLMKIYQKAISQ